MHVGFFYKFEMNFTYLVRGDFRPVITLNLLTVSIVIISLYTVLLTCFKD